MKCTIEDVVGTLKMIKNRGKKCAILIGDLITTSLGESFISSIELHFNNHPTSIRILFQNPMF
jgi:hypothetical protein